MSSNNKSYFGMGVDMENNKYIQNVLFPKSMRKKYKVIDTKQATVTEDRKEHWDIKLTFGNNSTRTFDVKAMKKLNRVDDKVNQDIQWIELKNSYGGPGWLYGKADYIAFEQENSFIIVNREKLSNLIDTLVVDNNVYGKKQLYKKYQRFGRKDEIVLINTSDMNSIIHATVKK